MKSSTRKIISNYHKNFPSGRNRDTKVMPGVKIVRNRAASAIKNLRKKYGRAYSQR